MPVNYYKTIYLLINYLLTNKNSEFSKLRPGGKFYIKKNVELRKSEIKSME